MPPNVLGSHVKPPIAPPHVRNWLLRDTVLLGLGLGCGTAFAALTVEAAEGQFLPLDAVVYITLAGWHYPLMIFTMHNLTALGTMPWLLPLIGLLMVLVWRAYGPHTLLLWSGYTLVSALLFLGVRVLVDRPRPRSGVSGYPSGHTLAAIALYGLLVYLLWPRLRSLRVYRAVICMGLWLIIIGVGFSRLLLAKHWLSDVLGAYMAGGIYLTTCAWFLERRRTRPQA
jgi:undecaprenyl-diphosphatase